MNQQILQEIKEKLDIVEFISNYVELKKAGNYYKGLCPFHQEKNPSFFVSPQKQIFKCFGCNIAGDVVTFYMRTENLSFKEAINNLAQKLNIDLKYLENSDNLSQNKKLLEINRIALNFFKKNLINNPSVINYLTQRGLTKETIEKFDLGYAERGSYLRDYLFNLGYNLDLIKEAGLLNEKNEDKFQGRIIFPLIDHKKRLVGFTGRLYPEVKYGPKYLNTAENKIFKKSKFLYGLVYSLSEIEKIKEIIIVEGQFDFLLAYQNGLQNIVAVSGSAFTQDQVNILKTYAKNFILAFDNDEAGFKSSWKSALMLMGNKLEVWKLNFEQAKDLADFFNSNYNLNQIKKIPFIDYIINYCLDNYNITNLEGKRQTLDLVLPLIKQLDNIKQGYYISQISKILELKEEFLLKELNELDKIVYNNFYQENSYISIPIDNYNERLENLIERYLTFVSILNIQEKIKTIEECLNEYNYLKDKFLNDEYYKEIINLRINYEKELNIDFEKELYFLEKEIKKEFYRKKIKEYRNLIKGSNAENILSEVKLLTDKLRELEKNQ
ncbi:MAG: DNA primase [Candidatus Parcubacteria bacterium]|nr:MAG: DNA primase [Candidatus Parcubacteria bacterium]